MVGCTAIGAMCWAAMGAVGWAAIGALCAMGLPARGGVADSAGSMGGALLGLLILIFFLA